MSSQNDVFTIALYNKLWDNLEARESRLWGFLALYGVAISLALGSSAAAGLETYGDLLVVALSLWAVLIVINGQWWSHRNRLMITRIEQRQDDNITKGLIPRAYQSPRFNVDSLAGKSIGVLALVSLGSYGRALGLLVGQGSVGAASLLYVIFVLGLGFCTHELESKMSKYLWTANEMDRELPSGSDTQRWFENGQYLAEVSKARKKVMHWRVVSLVLMLLAGAAYDVVMWWAGPREVGFFHAALVLEGMAVVLYVVMLVKFYHGKLKEDRDTRRWALWVELHGIVERANWGTTLLPALFLIVLVAGSAVLIGRYSQVAARPDGAAERETYMRDIGEIKQKVDALQISLVTDQRERMEEEVGTLDRRLTAIEEGLGQLAEAVRASKKEKK